MTTTSRGRQVERLAEEVLKADGWTVHRTVRSQFNANDIFGCVDLIAKKKGNRTRWIQVTAGSNIGEKIADLSQVPWDLSHDQVEVWLWKGKRMKHIKVKPGEKKREKFLESQFFQVRCLDFNYELEHAVDVPLKRVLQ